MKSHFQSSDATSIRTGLTSESSLAAGSKSWAPIHATPARRITTMVGIDHTTSSMRPEYSQSGWYEARLLEARYHHAKASVSTMTGTTTTSMMPVALSRISRSADDTGPCGSNTPARLQAASQKIEPPQTASRRTRAMRTLTACDIPSHRSAEIALRIPSESKP